MNQDEFERKFIQPLIECQNIETFTQRQFTELLCDIGRVHEVLHKLWKNEHVCSNCGEHRSIILESGKVICKVCGERMPIPNREW